ncbi:MAG: patatin-like phospholipase family protein [Patescibacteria group bacterium]
MILEGDRSVVSAIKEKKRLLDAGAPHEQLKILMICDGGLIKGAYTVGVGLALEELGYTDVFNDVVGISSGAPSAAYFLGGNIYQGGTLIYDECCSKRFLNRWRFWAPVDTNYIVDVLKGVTNKPLCLNKIFNSASRLHIGVSDFSTARPLLIQPTSETELLESIRASILLPSVARGKVFINGHRYFDGGVAYPHIISEAIKKIDFTHVLVLTSQNYQEETVPWFESLICSTIFRHRISRRGLFAFNNRRRARREALEKLTNNMDVRALVVWGDGSIGGTERNSEKVKAVVERSKAWWLEVMDKY